MFALQRGDVVAVLGGDGDEHFGLDADGLEPGAVFGFDLLEPGLAVVLEVHFVDQHGDLADAEQVQQVAVPAGIFLHAFVGVDQQQRRFGVGRAGDHVLQKLLVAGRVDDDVLALVRVEPDLGGIDGDVLVALGLERVHQVGPLEGHAAALGDLLELLQLALGQRAGVVEQPADKSGFAMVHVADNDDLQLLGGSDRRSVWRTHSGILSSELSSVSVRTSNFGLRTCLTCIHRAGVSRRHLRFPCPGRGRSVRRSWYGAVPR